MNGTPIVEPLPKRASRLDWITWLLGVVIALVILMGGFVITHEVKIRVQDDRNATIQRSLDQIDSKLTRLTDRLMK